MVEEFAPEPALPERPAEPASSGVEPEPLVADVAPVARRGRSKAAPKSAKDAVSAEPESAPAAPQLVVTSPTMLLFQAPPVSAGAAPDRFPDVPEENDAQGGQPSTRHRSRSRADRQPAVPDKPASQQRPARKPPEPITEPQKLKGSTRLEAKKQRRRDGRDASRRRTVVTEAEFLARRESVDRTMVVRAKDGRIEIAVLEDGVLAEHYVAKAQNMSLIGNVYLGRVQNVLPSMEAAFVDIGRGRNAVLYSGEVDWEAAAEQTDAPKNQARRIENALKAGDTVLVQVTKDPVGHKGARLTSQVSLPGRYLVYVPNSSMNGISRKLPDTERARLKKILKEVLPEHAGVIVRTAAEGATEDQLTRDVQRLTSQWEGIVEKSKSLSAPALLHSEPDLVTKIVRDIFNEDFTKLVIAGADPKRTIEEYLEQVAPDLLDRVEVYSGSKDVFAEYRIQEQIDKALDRKVWLPSGGSLVIDRTEAMTVVDVNTGKFVGSGGNLEETVTKNNLEAAEEIVRQLRLRDIGGIVVIDFIDMVLESNRDLVLRRLVECLSRDRTKHQVAEVTSLGLVQMTRKKIGLGLAESFDELAGSGSAPSSQQSTSKPEPAQQKRQNGRRRAAGQQPAVPAQSQTHALTDDVKLAVAQIVAGTVRGTSTGAVPIVTELVAQTESGAGAPPDEDAQPPVVEPDRGSPVLDIPLPPVREGRHDPQAAQQAEQLLGSVLDSLPDRKPSVRRSRRVTTGISRAGEPQERLG